MGIGVGFFKYVIFTPLTAVGFICMYIFGGGIITLFNTIQYLFSGHFIDAFIEYFITSALPPTSLAQVLFTVFVGAAVAGIKWFFAMAALGHRI